MSTAALDAMQRDAAAALRQERILAIVREREALLATIAAKERGVEVLTQLLDGVTSSERGFTNGADTTSPRRRAIHLSRARRLLLGPERVDFRGVVDIYGRGPLHVLASASPSM